MNEIYDWYDSLPEPWKFILFCSVIFPLVICVHSGILWIAITGAVVTLLFFFTRVHYDYGAIVKEFIYRRKMLCKLKKQTLELSKKASA